ncbi:MAG: oxygenase MpaB family protein, partial [Bradymonadaceae bacterium]
MQALDTAIRRGPTFVDGAPEALHALIDQVTTVPAWVDRERIDRGAAFFLSTHLPGGLVLGAKSLIAGYAAPAGNKPLVFSGRLQRGTHSRLAETSRFVYDVSRPGGLDPGADGIVSAVTVRLIHAQVRDMIQRRAPWNDDWGVPINQHDMLATLLLFSIYWQRGLETLGLTPSEREADDHIALWRYIGYLMGIDQELLPATRREAARYAEFIELTQGPPDDDARELTRSFLRTGPPDAPEERRDQPARALPRALARVLLGPELADDLDIDPTPLTSVLR